MKMKLTKIVYDHTDEGIRTVEYHSDGTVASFLYTPAEWNDILYWIRSNGLAIDVVKAIDEVSHG